MIEKCYAYLTYSSFMITYEFLRDWVGWDGVNTIGN